MLFNIYMLETHAQSPKIKFKNRLGDSTEIVNTAIKPPKTKAPKSLNTELSAGIQVNTEGYGLVLNYGKNFGQDQYGRNEINKFFNTHIFQLEIIEKKHPKEKKYFAANFPIENYNPGFIYGKINNFFQAKLSYGQRRLIAGKPDIGTYSIHWVNAAGFSAGFLKPYMLQLYGLGLKSYSEEIDQEFRSPSMVQKKGGLLKGWNEVEFIPGIHYKSGLHFDFSNKFKFKAALEVGVNIEYYFSKIDLMLDQKSQNTFYSLYATLYLGKKK